MQLWRRHYLLNLREIHATRNHPTSDGTAISVGDVVIMKDDLTKSNLEIGNRKRVSQGERLQGPDSIKKDSEL